MKTAIDLDWQQIQREVAVCRRCPRLVEWREAVGKNPPRRFRGEAYWSRPVPAFGDPHGRLLLVGLAPGAQGSNRTGRMFTGDRSGDWLFRALWKAGFANQPESWGRDDGLELRDALISAACRCAPPGNKPLPAEIARCRPFLAREMRAMPHLRIVLGLGKIGFDAAFDVAREAALTHLNTRPGFGHGTEAKLSEELTLLGTYHPSQQNTFTGKLTEAMLDAVFTRIRELLNCEPPRRQGAKIFGEK